MAEPGNHGIAIRSRLAIAAVGLLLAANIVVPVLWGDVYPFTSAPMFRDSPRQLCNYRVFSPAGDELPAANWNLQRVYDGNPVGYGVGIQPPRVIEQDFGVVHDEAAVRGHVERQFQRPENASYEFVDVVQEVIGPADASRLGIVETHSFRIRRPAKQ